MTNFVNLAKAAAKTLSFTWMPQIRVAVPSLARKSGRVIRTQKPVTRLERDDLMELFQTDLSKMKALKQEKAQDNVIAMRRPRMRPFTGVGQAA